MNENYTAIFGFGGGDPEVDDGSRPDLHFSGLNSGEFQEDLEKGPEGSDHVYHFRGLSENLILPSLCGLSTPGR